MKSLIHKCPRTFALRCIRLFIPSHSYLLSNFANSFYSNFAEQFDGWDEVEFFGKLGRKFNQSYVRYAPYLCKLWHKACIANRTSFHSFSWCMDLTVYSILEHCQKTLSCLTFVYAIIFRKKKNLVHKMSENLYAMMHKAFSVSYRYSLLSNFAGKMR